MKKPLNKMNKADLYELAKENRDIVKSLNINITMLSGENETLKVSLSDLREKYLFLNNESKINNKALKRHIAQKQLLEEEFSPIVLPKEKKSGFWRNLFG